MKRKHIQSILAGVLLLTLAGCDNDMNFSPTTPRVSNINNLGDRTLEISGTLTADGRHALEAAILYDGREIDGSRVTCPSAIGCTELNLSGVVQTSAGRHRISFQIVRQTQRAASYEAEGSVLVSREGLNLGGTIMNLGPRQGRLRARQSIDFFVSFGD